MALEFSSNDYSKEELLHASKKSLRSITIYANEVLLSMDSLGSTGLSPWARICEAPLMVVVQDCAPNLAARLKAMPKNPFS